jgi:hypothetical protein
VFADLDGDRTHDAYETVLRRVAPLGGRARLRSTVGRTRLVFQPNGTANGSKCHVHLVRWARSIAGHGARHERRRPLARGAGNAAAAEACASK